MGGLLGDFVKGRLQGQLPLALEQGIWLHRQLDAYSDRHPHFKASQARLGSDHRRIAGVLLDLMLDHFLAKHWGDFHGQPLEHYTARFYQRMAAINAPLPVNAKRWLRFAEPADLLAQYQYFEQLQPILERMDARRPRSLGLARGFDGLAENYTLLEADFFNLMPLLHERAGELLQQLPENFSTDAASAEQ